MSVATLTKLDQVTIGPEHLRVFVDVLDCVRERVDVRQADQIARVTTDLRVALGKWHKSISTKTDQRSIDRIVALDDRELLGDSIDRETLSQIELHLSRLISRHSNFGFGAANVPSDLDKYFPEGAVVDIRTARVHLRRVLAKPLPPLSLGYHDPAIVAERYSAIVLW